MPVTTQCSSSQHPILAILCSQICRANLSVARSLPQTSLPRCWSISQRLNKNWKSIKGTIPISFSISFNVSPEIITTTRESSILKAWTAGQDSANQVRPQRHLGTLKLWVYREVWNGNKWDYFILKSKSRSMLLALRSKQEDGGMNKMICLRARCLERSDRSGKRRNHLNWAATSEPWTESEFNFSLIPFPHRPHQYLGLNCC